MSGFLASHWSNRAVELGHYRKEGKLVDDTPVDGGRLKKEGQIVAEIIESLDSFQGMFEHLQGKSVGAVVYEFVGQRTWKHLVDFHIIGKPNGTVAVEPIRICRGEMGGNEGRVSPIQKTRGKSVVLGYR